MRKCINKDIFKIAVIFGFAFLCWVTHAYNGQYIFAQWTLNVRATHGYYPLHSTETLFFHFTHIQCPSCPYILCTFEGIFSTWDTFTFWSQS